MLIGSMRVGIRRTEAYQDDRAIQPAGKVMNDRDRTAGADKRSGHAKYLFIGLGSELDERMAGV